jgi:hypothetical protein
LRGGRGGNGCIILASFALLIVALALVIHSLTSDSGSPTLAGATARATATTGDGATLTPTAMATTATPSTTTAGNADQTPLPNTADFPVAQPQLLAPTGPLGVVRDYYSESYTYDIFTVRWRPGAFPPERAAEVAQAARQALDHDNQLLGTDNNEPLEIILSDTLFDEECLGCQGFAAADLRQVFILQDGSVAPDEFLFLLTHEIGHVLAYDYIADPNSLFFAEGFASWAMKDAMVDAGYLPPQQSAAWELQVGQLLSLDELRAATYSGRVRARNEYDGAESFTQFMIETYGLDAYKALYKAVSLDAQATPEAVVGKDWATLEQEWHAWLNQWNVAFNGAEAAQWWDVFHRVRSGFEQLYADPGSVSAEQYANLAAARVAINRADLPSATALIDASGLVAGAAQ